MRSVTRAYFDRNTDSKSLKKAGLIRKVVDQLKRAEDGLFYVKVFYNGNFYFQTDKGWTSPETDERGIDQEIRAVHANSPGGIDQAFIPAILKMKACPKGLVVSVDPSIFSKFWANKGDSNLDGVYNIVWGKLKIGEIKVKGEKIEVYTSDGEFQVADEKLVPSDEAWKKVANEAYSREGKADWAQFFSKKPRYATGFSVSNRDGVWEVFFFDKDKFNHKVNCDLTMDMMKDLVEEYGAKISTESDLSSIMWEDETAAFWFGSDI